MRDVVRKSIRKWSKISLVFLTTFCFFDEIRSKKIRRKNEKKKDCIVKMYKKMGCGIIKSNKNVKKT